MINTRECEHCGRESCLCKLEIAQERRQERYKDRLEQMSKSDRKNRHRVTQSVRGPMAG